MKGKSACFAAMLLLATLVAGSAQATVYSGSTSGIFNIGNNDNILSFSNGAEYSVWGQDFTAETCNPFRVLCFCTDNNGFDCSDSQYNNIPLELTLDFTDPATLGTQSFTYMMDVSFEQDQWGCWCIKWNDDPVVLELRTDEFEVGDVIYTFELLGFSCDGQTFTDTLYVEDLDGCWGSCTGIWGHIGETIIPEPATLALGLIGLSGMGLLRRRKKE